MYKALVLLSIVALSMAAETVQKRQVFLSSYPGSFNSVTYGGFPSVYYGGYPSVYGSPFFGSPFVTFEKPKEKKDGDDKKEEKKEDEKKEEKKEDEKKEGDKKDEVKTIQYIVPAFSSYPFWFRKPSRMSTRKKLIIDTDGVSDDIRGISMALQHPDVEIVAFTTTHGCVSSRQAAANVARTQRANGVQKRIPIFKGATTQLIKNTGPKTWDEAAFFGNDGIGDKPNAFPEVLESDFSCWDSEHAAQALIRLTKEHKDVTIVAIGPLTNLALAIKIDEDFKSAPARVVIMGGNYYGVGNVHSNTSAEFNFHGDPEAASIVLSEMEVPITVVPWEAFIIDGVKHQKEVDFDANLHLGTPLADFLSTATANPRARLAKRDRQYAYCDEIAIAAAIAPEKLIKESKKLRVAVELAGKYTRGQVMVDWVDQLWPEPEDGSNERGVDRSRRQITFVTAYDVHYVDGLVRQAVLRSGDQKA